MKTETGYVAGVNGNLIKVDFDGSVRKNEVGYILVLMQATVYTAVNTLRTSTWERRE